ncbi:hypothetical protein EC968_003535 [Mortierella alpina]|nr:hypothetical protein EC968_003535 [Mortierella alpina]
MSHLETVAHLPEEASTTMPRRSPLDIPELASLIFSFMGTKDLARCARVSRSLHGICIPILWRTMDIPTGVWTHDIEFHKGLVRYGKLYPVERLHLTRTFLQDFDLKLLAGNCTRLKHLDLTSTDVRVEDLRILIHSDPYGILDGGSNDGTKKRKARAHLFIKRIRVGGQHSQDVAELEEDDDSTNEAPVQNVNTMMDHYRQILEANTEPSTATHSKISPKQVFPGTKTWFPFYLESLSFKNSPYTFQGAAHLEVVSLLGPQLKRLVLDNAFGITDQVLIKLVKLCPNLVELQLAHTEITDEFLTRFALECLPSNTTSRHHSQRKTFGRLSLDMTRYLHAGDSVLFALVEDPAKKNADESAMAAPDLATIDEHAIDKSSLAKYRFSPNTVLTNINLSECRQISDVGLQALFRFATELTSVELNGHELKDGSLVVLAETYRNRLRALGMGVPAAWREHMMADERAQATGQTEATIALQNFGAESTSSNNGKTFTTGRVPGGLKRLSLERCQNITNRGVRTILRSCPGLEFLNISSSLKLTLQLFQGPWACTRLRELSMRGIALEVPPMSATVMSRFGTFTREHEVEEEEMESLWRFPLAITSYPSEDDFDEDGHYDQIVALWEQPPGRTDIDSGSDLTEAEQEADGFSNSSAGDDSDHEVISGDEGSSNGDEDVSSGPEDTSYGSEDIRSSSEDISSGEEASSSGGDWRGDIFPRLVTRHPVPRGMRRNTPRQRAILRAFYSQLGQLSQLQTLDMGLCQFRVRAKDGLELVLPGLQQNLTEWNLDYRRPYRMLDAEVRFFGKHFGFDTDYAVKRDGENRKARLQSLILGALAVNDVHPSILGWAGRQGFTITTAMLHRRGLFNAQ